MKQKLSPSEPQTVIAKASPATDRLKQLMILPDENISLAEAALVIAQEEYPGLDIPAYLHHLDDMAARLKQRLRRGSTTAEVVSALNRFLFDECGFAGNSEDYYDPRNSFINEVLERKTGIPITLSIVYMEIGRRIGLPLQGVSFPGHFLVTCAAPGGEMVLDPFSGGVSLTEDDLNGILSKTYGNQSPASKKLSALLSPAGKKEILTRLLHNLKGIYLNTKDWTKALSAIERILIIMPGVPSEMRDRGLVYLNMECFRAAAADLQRYLELEPSPQDGDEIRAKVTEIIARLN